mmetsp:Transcript_30251/g.116044  ORF Transcript_30251/g.116044 Transcript_30251/m.116044 type:complete len:197 (-) Transcript_30251:1165-1755(-)
MGSKETADPMTFTLSKRPNCPLRVVVLECVRVALSDAYVLPQLSARPHFLCNPFLKWVVAEDEHLRHTNTSTNPGSFCFFLLRKQELCSAVLSQKYSQRIYLALPKMFIPSRVASLILLPSLKLVSGADAGSVVRPVLEQSRTIGLGKVSSPPSRVWVQLIFFYLHRQLSVLLHQFKANLERVLESNSSISKRRRD